MAPVGGRHFTDRILKAAGLERSRAASPPPPPPPTLPPRPPRPHASPRGQRLGEGHNLYNLDEMRPNDPLKLVDIPISRYSSEGRSLAIGRQIAVNRSFVCYAMEGGSIRVFSRKTRSSALFKATYQTISDMALFSEDVNLLASLSIEGRIFVWEIDEVADKELGSSINGKMNVSIQLVGFEDTDHPRICWHSRKHEILFIGIQNYVFRIDTTKTQKDKISADELLGCRSGEAFDGVQLICSHEGPVTDLSVHQSVSCQLASASTDGSVMIMQEDQATPRVILKPHDGQSVGSVLFFSSPHDSDHPLLITAGRLNTEVKLWSLSSDEGCFPCNPESWKNIQTLELRSSDVFFNYIAVLPGASIILLANATKSLIYVVHVEYGLPLRATFMDYLAEASVLNGIFGISVTSDSISETSNELKVYCVQSLGVRGYNLDLSLCFPPPQDSTIESFHAQTPDIGGGKESEDNICSIDSSQPSSAPPTHSLEAGEEVGLKDFHASSLEDPEIEVVRKMGESVLKDLYESSLEDPAKEVHRKIEESVSGVGFEERKDQKGKAVMSSSYTAGLTNFQILCMQFMLYQEVASQKEMQKRITTSQEEMRLQIDSLKNDMLKLSTSHEDMQKQQNSILYHLVDLKEKILKKELSSTISLMGVELEKTLLPLVQGSFQSREDKEAIAKQVHHHYQTLAEKALPAILALYPQAEPSEYQER